MNLVIANTSTFRALLRKGWDPVIIADRLALALARARFLLVLPLARAASRFIEERDWFTFGYARLDDHARERFGRSGRWLRDLSSLDEATTRCPALARALTGEDGGSPVGSVAALLIARVATPESCEMWIERARRLTVRALRERVRRELKAASASASASGSASATGDCGAGDAGPDLRGTVDDPHAWNPDLITLRFQVPPAIDAAIEEAHDLHRAVCGGETTMSEFVEALVAEAQTGPVAPIANEGWIGARPSQTAREISLERKSEDWSYLHNRLDGEELCQAVETLEDTARRCREAKDRSSTADATIRALIHLENEIELRIGDLLALMAESGAWKGLMFAGVGHYAEERLGMSRSVAHLRCRLSRAFRKRKALRGACEDGTLGLEAASLVSRAMGPYAEIDGPADSPRRRTDPDVAALEVAWIQRGAEATIKRLREELRIIDRDRVLKGSDARMGPVEDERWQRYRARSAGQSIERLEVLVGAACESPTASTRVHVRLPLDLASMLRSAIDAERHRLETVCQNILRTAGAQDDPTAGVTVMYREAESGGPWPTVALAEPQSRGIFAVDACVGATSSPTLGAIARGSVCVTAGAASGTTSGAVAESLPSGSVRAALMFSANGSRVPEWCALLALLEGFVEMWDDPRRCPRRAADKVYVRDGWRCSAPGCTSRRNLEEHHIVYRGRGGGESLSNRVTLCRFHHQQGEHAGLLRCRGKAPLGILWSLGRHGLGGLYRNERRVRTARSGRTWGPRPNDEPPAFVPFAAATSMNREASM